MHLDISTSSRIELIDITSQIEQQVRDSRVQSGICVVSTRHTTTSIIINENESGLRSDILNLLEHLIPPSAGYSHDRIDNNADAHLKAVLLCSSETIPVIDGKLVLGTWQRIFFAELDGPRHRIVNVTLISHP
ncbi:MAG: secondary thiamine-phosphate synthase enzyme YjbQ [ANME-2 cluster archaeon]|nr:secondary thiamine-phosphate synthase enzyme YjbQ [ANME-2 cluster archaeon]